MANIEKQRERLIGLLKELFQLNQPDLDFGLYRIMHAKADQVSRFLDEDLFSIIDEAFVANNKSLIAETKTAYEAAIQQAKDFGASDPEATRPVQEAKAAFIAAKNPGGSEGDFYDHLYRFFERYYDNGDFMSLRYFMRESDGRATSYAVPYDGREVHLHWANRDQYYIKTSEHLTNATFDLTLAKELEGKRKELFENRPLKVHFRVVSAGEGEHNNVEAAEQNKRYFIIHKDEPLKLETEENGETDLVIQFEYRVDPEKSGQEVIWQKQRLGEAAAVIQKAISDLSGGDDFAEALLARAPTDKEKSRTLLEKYLFQYTARNTMDYFIHKDLGGFLRRELDFYIKNEVMRLDDIGSAEAPRVESYLAKIKVLRTIAHQLIDFLAQLEEFQKKLWLKKKFVMETHYCVTLDRVPESFYEQISENKQQVKEWKKIFAIEELENYTEPLKASFLKDNPFLILDTAFFPGNFREALLAEMHNLDENLDGHLIHSENFQALELMGQKMHNLVNYIYIDPPYNAQSSEILYKNAYKHSSWLSLINDRLNSARQLQNDGGVLTVAIDEVEQEVLGQILSQNYPNYEKSCIAVAHNPSGQQGDNFSFAHEYAYFIYPKPGRYIGEQTRANKEDWDIRNFRDVTGDDSLRESGANCFYPIIIKDNEIKGFGEICPPDYHPRINELLEDGSIAIYPIDPKGIERKWRYARNTVEKIRDELIVHFLKGRKVYDIQRLKKKFNFKSIWTDSRYSANNHGTQLLNKIIPRAPASYPKSLYGVTDCIIAGTNENNEAVILDYFAGSGTTGHAVININREDEGKRKYILVEMGEHFDTVLKPRIQKIIYSKDWNAGKPVNREGCSHCFKYMRLESYEDVLNNLSLNPTPNLAAANGKFARDYMLRYWLDVETKGSPSLMNIKNFDDPTAYMLKVKKPGTDECVEKTVDLVETFNWLIGLHVGRLDRWRGYDVSFKRENDPELPKDSDMRLLIDGDLREADDGAWQLRGIEGYRLRTPGNHSDRERVLIIWRKLTGNLEQDNLVLDEWFKKHRLSNPDSALDIIYVNGSNNLSNLRQAGEAWKVRLIEEIFHQTMWDTEG